GSIQFEFLGGNTLTSYPNTKYMKAKTVGTVTPGVYTVTITGQGSNGTPVHKRTVSLTVNTTVGPTICEDFSVTKFPPSSMFDEYTGTEYWSRNSVSAYGIGSGSAKFDFYNASVIPTVQSLTSNNFPNTAASSYLTFDEAYAPYTSLGPDTLVVQSSADFGATYSTLATLLGKADGTGELNTASGTTSEFTPSSKQWAPKIYSLPAGTNKIRLVAKSGYGNNLYVDNICVQVLPDASANTSCAIAEGFYRSTPVPNAIQDTIRLYLKRFDFPNITVDSAITVWSTSSGCFSYSFDKALSGNYYIVWKHRNSIETWTAVSYGYTRGASLPGLDIINDVSLVLGNNEKQIAPNPFYGMFGGDVIRDNVVNLNDVTAVTNDFITFETGYIQTDLTGDNITNLNDILIVYNNNVLFVARVAPAGATPEPPPSKNIDTKVKTFKNDAEKQKYESEKIASILAEKQKADEQIKLEQQIKLNNEKRARLLKRNPPSHMINSGREGKHGLE
ncbi:MAG: hypothetical protein ABI462_08615, partial [Ignavibacteria bacterium]